MAAASPWWRRLPLLWSPARKADLSLLDELIASEQELGFTASDEQTPAEVGERTPLFERQQRFEPTGPRKSQKALPQPRHVEDSANSSQPSLTFVGAASSPERLTALEGPPQDATKYVTRQLRRALPLSHYFESSTGLPAPPNSLGRLDFAGSTTRLAYRLFQEIVEVIRVMLLFVLVACLTLRFWAFVGLLTVSGLVIARE
jgi:hypothetical protein